MKILVTGYAGQLGYDVVCELNKRGYESLYSNHYTLNTKRSSSNFVFGADKFDFDITDAAATETFIRKVMPKAVVHCSAYTAVDAAEENQELCRRVNVDGTANIARVCKAIGAKMLYISTDYVFSGIATSSAATEFQKAAASPQGEASSVGNLDLSPDTSNLTPRFYETTDPTGPCNVYGQSKLDGELAVKGILEKYFIIRTSWVCGHHGKNFVETMLKLGRERESLNVVDDQVGSPTFTEDLARLIADMIMTEKYGTYHATNEGICSWAEFAAEIMKLAGLPCKINPIPSSQYLTKAIRPLNSRLSKASLDMAGFKRLPEWREALGRYIGISS